MQNLSLFADPKVILVTYWFGIDANFKSCHLLEMTVRLDEI